MGLPAKVSTTTSNLIIGVTALAGTSVYLAAVAQAVAGTKIAVAAQNMFYEDNGAFTGEVSGALDVVMSRLAPIPNDP